MVAMKKHFPFYLLVMALLVWFVANFFYGEKVLDNNGFGWDGVYYANITSHFDNVLKNQILEPYRAQRIFPSFMVYLFSKIFGYSLIKPTTMVKAFYIYNVLIIMSATIALGLIAKLRNWKQPIWIIAFSGLFLNYGILKMSVYYTILTDYTAFALGIWMLYFYLSQKKLGLIIITLVGAFTYPTMLISGLILLLFPKKPLATPENSSFVSLTLNIAPSRILLSVGIAFIVCLFAMYSLKTVHPSEFSSSYRTIYAGVIGQIPSIHSTLIGSISLLCLFLYFTFGIIPFIKKQITAEITFQRIYLALMTAGLVLLAKHVLINPALHPLLTLLPYLNYSYGGTLINPLIFFVAHFVYYGPILLLIVFHWNKIVAIAYEEGFGITALLFLYFFLAVGPESRQYFNELGIFVFFICEFLNKKNVSLFFSGWMILLSIAVSKCWFLINSHPLGYSMSQGQGMRDISYLQQLIGMIIVMLILYLWKMKIDRDPMEIDTVTI